jgi:O-antigen ligase
MALISLGPKAVGSPVEDRVSAPVRDFDHAIAEAARHRLRTATIILIAFWLVTRIPMRDFAAVRREVLSPAGGLPVALWAAGMAGLLWSDAPFAERINGVSSYYKLLAIPLLLAQFRYFEPRNIRRTDCAVWVLAGFLISCTILLVLSWGLMLLVDLPWRGRDLGIPVKDYIAQSTVFLLCAFGLLEGAFLLWQKARQSTAVGLLLLSLLFLINILFVARSRTALVVIPILLLVFGARRLGTIGVAGALVAVITLATLVWQTSPTIRDRITMLVQEAHDYDPGGARTSGGERLEFWRRSIMSIAEAPLLGHGIGSIPEQFRRSATGQTGLGAQAPHNPHNQIFAVAIELGLVGTAILIAMWIAHLRLFIGASLPAAIGLILVIQNIISSLFNSHLFDFTHGWLYVWGVGVIGGVTLRSAAPLKETQIKEVHARDGDL